VVEDSEQCVLGGGEDIVRPFLGDAVAQQRVARDTIKEEQRFARDGRGSVDVIRNRDLAHRLADFDELSGAGGGVCLELAAFGPGVGLVVMVDVAEEERVVGLVNDEPDVGTHSHGPESPIARFVQFVELHPGRGGVQLEIEGGGLDGLLLVTRETGEGVGECIGDAEGRTIITCIGR